MTEHAFYSRMRQMPLTSLCRHWFLFLGIAFLTGCASLTPWVKATSSKPYQDNARRFTATLPDGWMRCNLFDYFLLTKDGIVLESIVVERHRVDRKLESTKKRYQVDMSPEEVAGVEVDALRTQPGTGNFELLANEPASVAGQTGFRLEYRFTYLESGLRIHGILYGLMIVGKESEKNPEKRSWVYGIRYEAPDQYYFDRYKSDFKNFVQSLQVLK